MATLARRPLFPIPELPEWLESLPAQFAMPTMGDLYTVRIEDYTENGRYVMRAEIPGVSADDIDVVIL
ncbi:MAG: Hsp20/alpha crystallin family protein, partial [Streptomyces sp.]|nr:Hsp20/alpha crystallin family protein [Streptomyces sp.]